MRDFFVIFEKEFRTTVKIFDKYPLKSNSYEREVVC
jgi:hypothetical protein